MISCKVTSGYILLSFPSLLITPTFSTISLLLLRKKLGKGGEVWYSSGYGIYRLEKSRERGTQGDTASGSTTQEIGESGKRNRGINRRTAESCERNMDSVSTRGRIIPGAKKVWTEAWKPHGPDRGRTERYPKGRGREKTGGFRNQREAVDAGTDTGIHQEKVPEKDT